MESNKQTNKAIKKSIVKTRYKILFNNMLLCSEFYIKSYIYYRNGFYIKSYIIENTLLNKHNVGLNVLKKRTDQPVFIGIK